MGCGVNTEKKQTCKHLSKATTHTTRYHFVPLRNAQHIHAQTEESRELTTDSENVQMRMQRTCYQT